MPFANVLIDSRLQGFCLRQVASTSGPGQFGFGVFGVGRHVFESLSGEARPPARNSAGLKTKSALRTRVEFGRLGCATPSMKSHGTNSFWKHSQALALIFVSDSRPDIA